MSIYFSFIIFCSCLLNWFHGCVFELVKSGASFRALGRCFWCSFSNAFHVPQRIPCFLLSARNLIRGGYVWVDQAPLVNPTLHLMVNKINYKMKVMKNMSSTSSNGWKMLILNQEFKSRIWLRILKPSWSQFLLFGLSFPQHNSSVGRPCKI